MLGDALLLPGFGFQVALFEERSLKRFLDERGDDGLAELADRAHRWVRDLANASGTEGSLEQGFNQRIMCEGLGYSMYPNANASLWAKPDMSVTGLSIIPDVALGTDLNTNTSIGGVLELKRPGTDLDRPQARKERLTPVEQGFLYGTRILGCRWVLVSNMRYIRLYSIESQIAFLTIDLSACIMRDGRPSDDLRKLAMLRFDQLILGGDDAPVSSLLATSSTRKKQVEAGFFDIYFQIRGDLMVAVADGCSAKGIIATENDVLHATQRLLDRMLFLAYCEDHPQHLIPPDTVAEVTKAARRRPGPNTHKVYDDLKALFREVDAGSSAASGLALAAYNGELFKMHFIVDEIDLPDTLHDKVYTARVDGHDRRIQGVWGFSGFNFWQELDEHLLGSLFERSLPDTVTPQREQRRRHGIFYTDDIAANYIVQGVIESIFNELPNIPSRGDAVPALQQRLDVLSRLHVVDPTCGSGAFLVAAYRALLGEWTRLRETIMALQATSSSTPTFNFDAISAVDTQAKLLRDTLYGSDLQPQAVELAKLALWLRSARKGEKVANLGSNIVKANSLDLDDLTAKLDREAGTFDTVIGNPPWGVKVYEDDPAVYSKVIERLNVTPPSPLDSWELFILVGFHLLKDGGRLAFVLPDTLFAPEKDWIRRQIVERSTLERVANLGMDWFGEMVRIGAVAFQTRYVRPSPSSTYTGFALYGKLRRDATRGRVLLPQIEHDRGKECSQAAIIARPDTKMLVTQGVRDDVIMAKVNSNSAKLSELTTWIRGEELSGYGVLWRCLGCGFHTTPPDRRRERATKLCPGCSAKLDLSSVETVSAILESAAQSTVPLVDTEDIHKRYGNVVPSKHLRTGLYGWEYKDPRKFEAPKLLIREAGVGVTCGLDYTDARCVRSMYVFHITDAATTTGYAIEYVLAALQSRTMHYYAVQITNQGDPRRPFANLRMGTVGELPIPTVNFKNRNAKRTHDDIVALVKRMLDGAAPGGPEDLEIESLLRELWGLDGNDGVYVAKELSKLPPFGRLAQMNDDEDISEGNARQRHRGRPH